MDLSGRDPAVARVARVFEAAADDYDQSGADFFGPIAARLCELAAPSPGERVVDLGCGRGAVTLRLARAVAPDGSVVGVDLSPTMLAHTEAAAARAGLLHVTTELGDVTAPDPSLTGCDLLTASLVVFFLPDPAAAVARWLRLVRPGGRVAISTFGVQDAVWAEVDALFAPHLPPGLLDPRTRGTGSLLGSDDGVAGLLATAGGSDVRTVRESLAVRFTDATQWRAWSLGTGQRAFWGFVPPSQRDELFASATAVLEQARDGDGLVLHQDVRYTLCTVGAASPRPSGEAR